MGRGKSAAPSALSIAVSEVVSESIDALGMSTAGFARDSGIGRSRLIDLLNAQAAWTITEVELAGRVFGHTVSDLIAAADPDSALQVAGLPAVDNVVRLPVSPATEDGEGLLGAALDMGREPGTTIEDN
jgi:hypothetical protein